MCLKTDNLFNCTLSCKNLNLKGELFLPIKKTQYRSLVGLSMCQYIRESYPYLDVANDWNLTGT